MSDIIQFPSSDVESDDDDSIDCVICEECECFMNIALHNNDFYLYCQNCDIIDSRIRDYELEEEG